MFSKKYVFIVFVFSVFSFIGLAQNKALLKIDTEDLKKHLTFLASDSLQGRKLGTQINGLEIAADYISGNAKQIGLMPGAENYFQDINLVSSRPNNKCFIELQSSAGKCLYHSESIIDLSGSTGEIIYKKEEIVVAGFGFVENDNFTGRNEEIDLSDKIVVVAQGNSKVFQEGKEFRWNNRLERSKIEIISAKNPKAIVFVTNPKDKNNTSFGEIKSWMNRERFVLGQSETEVQLLIAVPEFADKLLGGKGKYGKYLSLESKKKSPPFLVENVFFSAEIGRLAMPVDAKNVIGYVEGNDPQLKDECVVFMAHYDHLGIGENGEVYNGADDNASGTVTLLEVAEAFASLDKKPKRSIVFLWVTCEEIGMFGSKYYAENPVFPMNKTKACINIDMDGRVYEPRDSVWNKSPKKVKDFDGLFTLANDIWPELKEINSAACRTLSLNPDYSLPNNFLRSSDHYYFHSNGVPILNYSTGYHADYHKIGDEVAKINFEKMKRVCDLCFLVGLEIANF